MSELLRFATAGSVDDGKSTLIGRLLYDSKSIFEDQLESVERVSRERGEDYTNLALLTDGLRAEREQGITIDVAYRYFATPKRKFIIADTPGHVQYTRNMVTGASTADVALILVDARNGVLEQSRRHAFLSSLLGIRHLVVCVNKMDLVDWSQARFEEIRNEFREFATRLEVHDLTFIPMSALKGDNVVDGSENMPWYHGQPLLELLENIHIASDRNLMDSRFPVQYVIRPMQHEYHDYRGFAGTVAGGVFRVGDEVMVLPSGRTSTISAIDTHGGSLQEAYAPMAVTIRLADQVDISRGDMLCRPHNAPTMSQELDATVCWMSDTATLEQGRRYVLKHTTRTTRASVVELQYRLDVNTLHRDEEVTSLSLNEIGRIRLRTQSPLFFDEYRRNRVTGSFILVDETSGNTVAAGMLREAPTKPTTTPASSPNVVWQSGTVSREQRWDALGHAGATVWLTGLSGSGKSTVASELERMLLEAGRSAFMLDGDNLRYGLNADLGFSAADRTENVRRVGEVAKLFADAGTVAIVPVISPYAADRDRVRRIHEAAGLEFIEVFVDTPLEECERRDPKGLYKRARAGEIAGFTGIDDPYEEPLTPELILRPVDGSAAEQAQRIITLIQQRQR
ncbi:MAG: Bifunctional enzyme CysN/CysC [Actinomycetota bacterium]